MHWQGRSIDVSLDCVLIWNIVVFAKCSSEVHKAKLQSALEMQLCRNIVKTILFHRSFFDGNFKPF